VMPTGGGKSLCYQIPALLLPGITVVVSPLIALMQDQVSQLEAWGIPAVFLNSSLEWGEYVQKMNLIRQGKVKLLYVSPEGLGTSRIQDILHSEKVELSCITIDEAHCVSEWGHDFRPDYMEIACIREQFPSAVCLALTATATKQVQGDIVKHLRLENPAVLVASFNRPNLFLDVRKKSNPFEQTQNFLLEHKGESGIIYCFSRRQVDELTEKLAHKNFSVLNYHAGLSDDERSQHQKLFIQDKVDVMVATLAFGMGINKPNVRFVLHYDMPKSIEQYYQEIGRAGRDGLPATALLLYSYGDLHKIRYFFEDSADPQKAEKLLQGMVSYAEAKTCRRQQLLAYFGEPYMEASGDKDCCCDICSRGGIKKSDVTLPFQKYLSCIARTRQRFGAAYVIDVLLGSKNKRIIENGDDQLSTWGIGRELSKQDWMELNSCLIASGYIEKCGDYGTLAITELGLDALKNRKPVFLPVEFSGKKASPVISFPKKKTKTADDIANDDEALRIADSLRSWRRKVADEMNVPPYVIFGDKTLYDIASRKPTALPQLMDCYGIGEAKAQRFWKDILRIVKGE
ncbi:MAG: DNA helicase RecQ, partial [Treponema sp.]|nr:DNA helicase RecQ [Treponema sp.]